MAVSEAASCTHVQAKMVKRGLIPHVGTEQGERHTGQFSESGVCGAQACSEP